MTMTMTKTMTKNKIQNRSFSLIGNDRQDCSDMKSGIFIIEFKKTKKYILINMCYMGFPIQEIFHSAKLVFNQTLYLLNTFYYISFNYDRASGLII